MSRPAAVSNPRRERQFLKALWSWSCPLNNHNKRRKDRLGGGDGRLGGRACSGCSRD
jgi:hypothetical protein